VGRYACEGGEVAWLRAFEVAATASLDTCGRDETPRRPGCRHLVFSRLSSFVSPPRWHTLHTLAKLA
jgi:hypothetical protein